MADAPAADASPPPLHHHRTSESPPPSPWPEDAPPYTLYQPERMLLPDRAQSLAVQAYLRMRALPLRVCHRANAEHMSPSPGGHQRLPLVRAGRCSHDQRLASGLDETVRLARQLTTGGRSAALLPDGSPEDDVVRIETKAYAALIESRLVPAELYVLWSCGGNGNAAASSRRRYAGARPWPLNHALAYRKQREVRARLAALGWAERSPAEVREEVGRCCGALSQRLGDRGRRYFFGERPTELDALVFGHLFGILSAAAEEEAGPDGGMEMLAEAVKSHGNLVAFCEHVNQDYFVAAVAQEVEQEVVQ